jgi:[ribosomal protein S5]-alanine N-acetyltransferase
MIHTNRLILLPLTHQQLIKYIANKGSLEKELQLNETSRIISPELKEALQQTILPCVADSTKNYLYATLWTAILKADNRMIGDACFKGEPNAEGEIEIGYGTYEEFQGKGFMTEIVGGLIAWAKKQKNVKSITVSTEKANVASFKVLQKNGFFKASEDNIFYYWRITM